MTVDILIPFHGHMHLLRRCLGPLLASLRQLPADRCPSICLVDDASPATPGYGWLAGIGECTGQKITVLRLPARSGFIGAINHAWSQTAGDCVILLNNDTIPGPNLVMNLVSTLEMDETLAAVGPTTDNPKDLYQYRSRPPNPGAKKLRPTRYLTGACLALRRNAIKEDRLFDSTYSPGYFEDLDLCCRLRARGWRLAILENERLHHTGAATFADHPGITGILQTNYTTFTTRWSHLPGHRELDLLLWT